MIFTPIFTGFDPFIEGQRWSGFYTFLINDIHHELARLLAPLYQVKVEAFVGLHMRHDISVWRGMAGTEPFETSTAIIGEATRTITPTIYDIEETPHIEIRDDEGRLVTVIEILSPSNKDSHRNDYLIKRDAILAQPIHLVEIDLLRRGKRMETSSPKDGYVIMVARAQDSEPHRAEMYEFGLRDPLPVIPIPLKKGDADVPLDLPMIFEQLYSDARYRYYLDYEQIPKSLGESDREWITGLLAGI